MNSQVKAPAAIACGACKAENTVDAKYCRGCGQGLYESCAGCGKSVLLSQKFCGSCGANLDASLQARHDRHEELMADAVQAAREYDYHHALALLQKLATLKDYRFRETAEHAEEAISKIEIMRDRAAASAQKALARSKVEFDNGNHTEVVRLLEAVPARLVDEDAKTLLARVKSYAAEVTDLATSLSAAIEQKNWPLVGGLVDQVLVYSPDDQRYLQLAQQVAAKLHAIAKQMFSSGKYVAALEQLQAVPVSRRDDDYERISQTYHEVEWLSKQFDIEPFATGMLGRLAVRFAKEVPGDAAAQQQVKQLAAKLKQADRSQRNPYPAWKGSADCWMGGATGVLGRPASISPGQQKPLKGCVARFHVAIGLALQGLGKARISQQFASKNGRLKAIGWRKKKRCWGIDIGTAAIKAVCLTETDEGLEVVDSYFEEFSDPVCRTTVEVDKAGVVKSAVEKMLATKEIADTPVWANIAASNLVNRFVRLPPVSDKQAALLLESEIDQRIPIPKDDLAVVRWMGPKGENEIHGRPAVITGAKKDVVRERMRLLTDAGLTLSGLQGDTLAIVNFAAYEFAESLRLNESNAANEIGSEGSDVDDRAYADDPSQNRSNRADQTPAVALVECGAATTNLVIVSDEAHWAWSIESGGENLTAALARQSKTGQSEAEQLKRNPAALTLPSKDYASVEQRQDELRMRIERVFEDAMLQNPRFRVIQSWCLGGGCLAHQWIRRLMLKK